LAAAFLGVATTASAGDDGVHAFTLNLNEGTPKKLADYRGKALLLVTLTPGGRRGIRRPGSPAAEPLRSVGAGAADGPRMRTRVSMW